MRQLVDQVSASAAELAGGSSWTDEPARPSSPAGPRRRRFRAPSSGLLWGATALLLALVLCRLAGGGLQGWAVGLGMDDERGTLLAALIVAAVSAGIVAAITGRGQPARVGGVLAIIAIDSRLHVGEWILQLLTMLLLAVVLVSTGAAVGLLVRSDLAALTRLLRRRRRAWVTVVIGLSLGAVALGPATTAVQDGPISALYDYSPGPVISPHNQPAGAPVTEVGPRQPPEGVAVQAPASGEAPAGGAPPAAATPITAAASAAAVAARQYAGHIDTMTIGGRTTLVYVPRDYAVDTGRAFPVVYFLHGYPGNAEQWVGVGAQLPEILDQLIGDGVLPPLLAAMPDGNGEVLSDSEWGDTAHGDRVENWLVSAVIPAVDRRYRTLGAQYRGIAGLSAGGFGAVNLCLRHPDLFRWAASYSGYFTARQNVFGAGTAANSPAVIVGHLAADQRMPLYVGIGEVDAGFSADNRHFVDELSSLGWTALHSDTVPGGHGWEAWRLEMVHSLRWLGMLWSGNPLPTQPPTRTPMATPSPGPTPAPTRSPTPSRTPKPTPTPTPTPTPSPAPTPSGTPTPTPGADATASPRGRPHPTPTPTTSPSPSPSASPSPKPSPSQTPGG